MFKHKHILIQGIGLVIFCLLACASSSSQGSSGSSHSSIDYRGAAVGAAAGYNGYIPIGKASSDSQARQMAADAGYSYYLYDTNNGVVYAK